MDIPLEELQELTSAAILREAISIPRAAPRTFLLITLTLIFPLSFAILAHSLFTHPILLRLEAPHDRPGEARQWLLLLLLLYQFLYLLFLFTFSLLSTAAVVFTVASLFTSKGVSFSSTLSAIPPVFFRLFRTFLWFSAALVLYNLAFAVALLLPFLIAVSTFYYSFPFILLLFLAIHVYISGVWHLASVVTVLEPVCGMVAMRKSQQLLVGRARMAGGFVLGYILSCGVISMVFRTMVLAGGTGEERPITTRAFAGAILVAALVVVNLVGLLLQSVFYYVCKSYHNEPVDKRALYEQLGGYLGEYVPLRSSVQMETM